MQMLIMTCRISKSIFAFAVLYIIMLVISSCNKPPNNGVPIYLNIDSPSVISVYPFGASTCNIPDVWATSGSANLGAYETPINIPILASGNVPIAVSAGIHDYGIVSIPVQYPFYAPDTFTLANAIPGHIYHHHPVYSYFSYTQVGLNADFELTNPFTHATILPLPSGSNTALGLKCGGIIIPATTDSITAFQTTPIQINTNGRQAYVEMDFKMNNPNVFCDVGIIATLYSGTTITETTVYDKEELPPLPNWTKIYIDFNNEIGGSPNYYFQIYFAVHHLAGVQDTMFIDNVKL
jgi:hypothetical protein